MNGKARALLALQVLCCLTMALGLFGVVEGILHRDSIPLFAFDVPTWILGASAMYMGLRYYRRIPEMEAHLRTSPGFSWSNFKPGKKK